MLTSDSSDMYLDELLRPCASVVTLKATDARLYHRCRERLVKAARREGLVVKQSYRHVGKRLGRPLTASLHADQVRKMRRSGMSQSAIARELQIGRTSVRRILSSKKS